MDELWSKYRWVPPDILPVNGIFPWLYSSIDIAAMRNRKNIISFLTKSLLVFVFLVVVVMVFTPRLINLEMVKNTIEENISSNVGGRITYRNLKLSYFPRPHVVMYGAEISVPESYTINIQWMRIYPKILPLLQGQYFRIYTHPLDIDRITFRYGYLCSIHNDMGSWKVWQL